jgi:ribosomal-protein-alanine N-acetyltransferase
MRPYHYPEDLQTKRLVARYLTEADVPAWAEFFKDEEAIEFFPMYHNRPPEESAKEWIEKQLTRYAKQEYGMQALIEKKTNTFIGQCGLVVKIVDGVEELEVGYGILKKFWGQGYAPEAARIFIDFAFTHHLTDSIISTIALDNLNSQRVAEKNGLVREKIFTMYDMELYVYRLPKIMYDPIP